MLLLLAAFWNERDWIEPALAQIDAIDPDEIIISDGSFDPNYPASSDDGTRELIEAWRLERRNARVVSPIRRTRFQHIKDQYRFSIEGKLNPIARYRIFHRALRVNTYRLNQAATFASMARISKIWRPGNWCMTYDADQFYSDSQIEIFKNLCKIDEPVTQITGSEVTYFKDFCHVTRNYEKRKWNNFPFKIKGQNVVLPTRHFMYQLDQKILAPHELNCHYTGIYHHYKFRPNSQRDQLTYKVGDRQPPEKARTIIEDELTDMSGHPNIISTMRSNPKWTKYFAQ